MQAGRQGDRGGAEVEVEVGGGATGRQVVSYWERKQGGGLSLFNAAIRHRNADV